MLHETIVRVAIGLGTVRVHHDERVVAFQLAEWDECVDGAIVTGNVEHHVSPASTTILTSGLARDVGFELGLPASSHHFESDELVHGC